MKKNEHYAGLDMLRLIAACLVVLGHFGLYSWNSFSVAESELEVAFPFLRPMELVGSIGVEVFFLISGFIISASAVGNTALGFAMRRAIRILPALWVSGLLALFAKMFTGASPAALLSDFARSAVLSPIGPYIDGVVWTLVVEAVFYTLILAVLLSGQMSRLSEVAKALGTVSALFIAVAAVCHLFADENLSALKLAEILGRFPFKVLLLKHGVFFAVGMLVWSSFGRSSNGRDAAWISFFLLFCSLEIYMERKAFWPASVSLLLWWTSFSILVINVMHNHLLNMRIGRYRSAMRACGLFSYPLYLNHYSLGMVIVPFLAASGLSGTAAFLLAVMSVGTVAFLVMHFPERMMQSKLYDVLKAWENRDRSFTRDRCGSECFTASPLETYKPQKRDPSV